MPRANLTSSTVIAAAADLADREGFGALTLTELARHLGVQTASLYSHVRDRAALLDGVSELALDELGGLVATAIAGRSAGDALVGLADAHRSYAREYPGRWAALQRDPGPSVVASTAAARLSAQFWAVLRGYPISEDEFVHATRLLGATINGFVSLERSSGFAHRAPESEVSWRRALDALDSILRRWPPESMNGVHK